MRKMIPNSCPIPNVILDEWQRYLSGAELHVVLAIARKTYGWGKDEDRISVSQLVAITGLSRRTIITTCDSLEAVGILRVNKAGDGKTADEYRLSQDSDSVVTALEDRVIRAGRCRNRTPAKRTPVQKWHDRGAENAPRTGAKTAPTRNNLSRNTYQETLFFPPNPPDPAEGEWEEKSENGPEKASPEKELLVAFRSQRHSGGGGGAPVPNFTRSSYLAYRDILRSLHVDGYTPEQFGRATAAAMQRFSHPGMVNPRSVARHIDSLLAEDTHVNVNTHANNTSITSINGRRPAGLAGRTQSDTGKTPGTGRKSAFPSAAEIVRRLHAPAAESGRHLYA